MTTNDILKTEVMDNNKGKRKYKDRGIPAPSIPKGGVTKRRRRLENGGKSET